MVTETQKVITEKFLLTYNQPSLRKSSELTGIQITRVFRLFNGSPMRLSEYESFKVAIERSRGKVGDVVNLLDNVLIKSDAKNLDEWEIKAKRKLKLWAYIH